VETKNRWNRGFSMRNAIITGLVALAIVAPSAVEAQTVEPTASYSVVQKPPRKAKVPVRKVRKARGGTTKAQSKAPETIAENPDASRRGAKVSLPPPCATQPQTSEIARRCLSLAQLGEPPRAQMLASTARPVEPATETPLATPSRSWLGGLSKAIITTCVKLAETYSNDRDDHRDAMAADIQWELQQARLKEQEKTKQAARASNASDGQPRRFAGL
jgi:hypothetical protein